MLEELKMIKKLDDLRARHKALNEQFRALSASALNALTCARLRKQMFQLRNEITRLEQIVYPSQPA